MNVTFVHSINNDSVSYSHGIAALVAVLRRELSAAVRLISLTSSDVEKWARTIHESDPSIVLFSATSNQWDLILAVARAVRSLEPGMPIVAGGAHPTARGEAGDSPFDVLVIGEAERIIADLVQDLCSHSSRRSRTTRLLRATAIDVLDDVPMPALDIFRLEDILAYPSVMFSRGCPYACTYCMSRRGGYAGHVRWKSPRRAVAETLSLIDLVNPETIYVDDDTLLKNPRWLDEFSELYRAEVTIPFCCNARPETVSSRTAHVLARAGCSAIGIGVESGSERIRSEVLGRPMSDEAIVDAFRFAHEAGLKTWSFNMVGLPTETADDLLRTIELNERTGTGFVRVSIFTPFPGSPLGSAYAREVWPSFFRPPDSLSHEMRAIYDKWITELNSQGRLWLTEAERDMVLTHRAVEAQTRRGCP